MSRIAVYLFFIAILQTGIITFSQTDDEETTTKPTDVEPDKVSEVPSKVEAEENSGVSSKTEPKVDEASDVPQKKNNKQTEETKANESKKENVTEKTSEVLFGFGKNIFGSVNDAGVKIGEAVSKSIDSATNLAGGTFNYLRTSATNLFIK